MGGVLEGGYDALARLQAVRRAVADTAEQRLVAPDYAAALDKRVAELKPSGKVSARQASRQADIWGQRGAAAAAAICDRLPPPPSLLPSQSDVNYKRDRAELDAAIAKVVGGGGRGGDDDDVVATMAGGGDATLRIKCPITRMRMKDPVRNAGCSHVYERSAIEQMRTSAAKRGKPEQCPVCKKPLTELVADEDTLYLINEDKRKREADGEDGDEDGEADESEDGAVLEGASESEEGYDALRVVDEVVIGRGMELGLDFKELFLLLRPRMR
jgi:hypothetical protein